MGGAAVALFRSQPQLRQAGNADVDRIERVLADVLPGLRRRVEVGQDMQGPGHDWTWAWRGGWNRPVWLRATQGPR